MSKELVEKLSYLDILISKKSTGTPKELAFKLRVSERGLYNYINLLKDLGAPIKYCRIRNSYYYTSKGFFYFKFKYSD